MGTTFFFLKKSKMLAGLEDLKRDLIRALRWTNSVVRPLAVWTTVPDNCEDCGAHSPVARRAVRTRRYGVGDACKARSLSRVFL